MSLLWRYAGMSRPGTLRADLRPPALGSPPGPVYAGVKFAILCAADFGSDIGREARSTAVSPAQR